MVLSDTISYITLFALTVVFTAFALVILSLPFAVFGMIFWIAIFNDFLGDKKDRIWKFEE
jgi:hypothetical protein